MKNYKSAYKRLRSVHKQAEGGTAVAVSTVDLELILGLAAATLYQARDKNLTGRELSDLVEVSVGAIR